VTAQLILSDSPPVVCDVHVEYSNQLQTKGTSVTESVGYLYVVVASQCVSWIFGQLLRVRYSISAHCPAGLFERNSEHCLILAPTRQTYLDTLLLMVALGYRLFRALVPVRTLGTQDFRSPLLEWLKPPIKIIYWLEGVTEEQVVLQKALLTLKQAVQWEKLHLPRLSEIRKTITVPKHARPYLERMALDRPQTIKERLLRRALLYALASVEAI
jgi:hypothetical protein